MSSWISHFRVAPASLTALGMNADELARNPMATATVDPRPQRRSAPAVRATGSFDAVTCCVSVDYLVRPVEVFAEVGRVLRPGGLLVVHVLQPLLPDQGDQGVAGERRHGAAGDRARLLRGERGVRRTDDGALQPGSAGRPAVRGMGRHGMTGPLGALEREVVACRACPRLVAWREQVAVERRAAFRDESYWGRPDPGLRRPGGVDRRARAGAGGPRRQPHRARVHRRPQRRLPVRVDAPRRARQPADLDPQRRRARVATACG